MMTTRGCTNLTLMYKRVLRKGVVGNDVKLLQEALIKLGYDPKGIDGSFGPGCEAAVKQFQKDNNLIVDGFVGPQTIRVINANLHNMDIANPTIPPIYRKDRMYSSNIHILELDDEKYFVDLDLGIQGKHERVSTIVKQKLLNNPKTLGAINAGFFIYNTQREHLGMLIDDGLYYSPPSSDFIDFIYYKNGESKIINLAGYDQKMLSELQRTSYWAIGTSYSLVQNGKINLENSEKFSHAKYRNPRTLLGRKADGSFLLVVVDGRTSANMGVTAAQSADIMLRLGAVQAVNLDGGGSSTLVLVEGGIPKIKNAPSNSGRVERAVGSVLIAYQK